MTWYDMRLCRINNVDDIELKKGLKRHTKQNRTLSFPEFLQFSTVAPRK